MAWVRHTVNSQKLKQQNDRLTSALIQVREQLQTAERHRVGLEVLLDMRQERVDALTEQVDRLRRANGKLETEAEHLAQLFRDNSTPAPK